MLKPIICVACEKVIVDQQEVASLISLFNKINASVLAGSPEVPKNAVSPKEWAIFSAWDCELGDERKKYVHCTQVLYPDRSRFSEIVKLPMHIEPPKRSQVIVNLMGFPVGQPGRYTIQTWIEENEETVVGPIDFTIEVEISKQEHIQLVTS